MGGLCFEKIFLTRSENGSGYMLSFIDSLTLSVQLPLEWYDVYLEVPEVWTAKSFQEFAKVVVEYLLISLEIWWPSIKGTLKIHSPGFPI